MECGEEELKDFVCVEKGEAGPSVANEPASDAASSAAGAPDADAYAANMDEGAIVPAARTWFDLLVGFPETKADGTIDWERLSKDCFQLCAGAVAVRVTFLRIFLCFLFAPVLIDGIWCCFLFFPGYVSARRGCARPGHVPGRC